MANTFKVTDLVGKEALRILHETPSMIMTADRQFDEDFKYKPKSGPYGQTIRVREPNEFTVREGSRIMDVQDITEETQNFTVATQDGVDMDFTNVDLVQSVNSEAAFDDLSKNYIEPAVKRLVSLIDSKFLAFATKNTYNVAGTAGTAITNLTPILDARAKINKGLAPPGDRYVQIESLAMSTLVNGAQAYFNPAPQIGKQYMEGKVMRTGAADFIENERIWSLTNIADVTGTTDAAALVTDGGSTMDIHTTVASPAVGSVFTVAGVFACHQETKAAYPYLQQFVVLETSASGALTVSPKTRLTGPRKNMCKSDGSNLATTDFNSKTLTFVGAASTTYPQQLMYQKEAFQIAFADLPIMDDAHKCSRIKKGNISVLCWFASDIRNFEMLMRLDVLYGFAAFRPQFASRIIGSASA